MYTVLMLSSGIFWTLTYILIIRRGILDKTYGMPLAALCANISWEFIFSFIFPTNPTQLVVNIIWFALDAVIFFLLLRYGAREFPGLSKQNFYIVVALALPTAFALVLLGAIEFHAGVAYTAFGQNLMMSILFIAMLYRRRSLRGQSSAIAICKLIGTLCASLAYYFYAKDVQGSVLLPFLYVSTLVYDGIYLGMVVAQSRIGIISKTTDEAEELPPQSEQNAGR
jgi:hypothetical protein